MPDEPPADAPSSESAGAAKNSPMTGKTQEIASAVSYTHLDVYKRQDNAAMIGSAAFYRLMRGEIAGLDLNACPSLKLV